MNPCSPPSWVIGPINPASLLRAKEGHAHDPNRLVSQNLLAHTRMLEGLIFIPRGSRWGARFSANLLLICRAKWQGKVGSSDDRQLSAGNTRISGSVEEIRASSCYSPPVASIGSIELLSPWSGVRFPPGPPAHAGTHDGALLSHRSGAIASETEVYFARPPGCLAIIAVATRIRGARSNHRRRSLVDVCGCHRRPSPLTSRFPRRWSGRRSDVPRVTRWGGR
jgi:hypothetical protein